ncbi:uncharacterized protein [Haliotis cracherodii]|uniref:uncharacterized protein n=1 Tax=Haliotis cracherodii TaxID=6455 RepID=UPI0039EA7A6B
MRFPLLLVIPCLLSTCRGVNVGGYYVGNYGTHHEFLGDGPLEEGQGFGDGDVVQAVSLRQRLAIHTFFSQRMHNFQPVQLDRQRVHIPQTRTTECTTTHLPHPVTHYPREQLKNPKQIFSKVEPPLKTARDNQQSSSKKTFLEGYKNDLTHLIQKMALRKGGRQILEKLNIIEKQMSPRTGQMHSSMTLNPEKIDRLLRVLVGLKSSESGRNVLHQLDLTRFARLKDPISVPATRSGTRVSNADVPVDLDFSAYNFNGGPNCVDELFRSAMDRYTRNSKIDEVYGRAPGYITTEMDMVLTGDQWKYFYNNMSFPPRRGKRSVDSDPPELTRHKRKAIKHNRYYWPGKVIPYAINEEDFSWSDIMLFERAMYDWEQATCIRFKMSTANDQNRIRFRNGAGCSSHVGMIGGVQNITLQGPCRIRRIVLHEIGHSIGLVHEHQRPDRDRFITILHENARPGTEWDFKKRTWATVVNHTVGYDYKSVMHYGPKAFSMDRIRPTILAKDTTFQDVIGKVTELSFDDKKLVNMMYRCSSHCSDTLTCNQGGYLSKNCRCICRPEYPNCEVYRKTDTRDFSTYRFYDYDWMSLFAAFSWNALNTVGFTNDWISSADPSTAMPSTNSRAAQPNILHERYDTYIPRPTPEAHKVLTLDVHSGTVQQPANSRRQPLPPRTMLQQRFTPRMVRQPVPYRFPMMRYKRTAQLDHSTHRKILFTNEHGVNSVWDMKQPFEFGSFLLLVKNKMQDKDSLPQDDLPVALPIASASSTAAATSTAPATSKDSPSKRRVPRAITFLNNNRGTRYNARRGKATRFDTYRRRYKPRKRRKLSRAFFRGFSRNDREARLRHAFYRSARRRNSYWK